ncbi:MAG TPA: BadF/BadG/BcrA/BcrD ATPase family protein [Candidatus Humimicrobiaceae bacterium]|nr:BadF/BadG/BcrA/BcrD ATPase family protein [Candidatus Humimicrobiaceae bacterium]
MLRTNQEYVIGVDGGGSKTTVVLVNLKSQILVRYQADSSHPRNIGIKNAIKNLAQAIEKVLGKIRGDKKILSTFLGLPAMEEEFKSKKDIIKKELLKHKKIQSIFKGKLIIGSDQLAGFRSGADEKDGIVLIGGSGCATHGWRKSQEVKVDAWGYLSEMGSAFWVGQKALQAIWRELDGRGPKTLITKLVFQKLKIKNKETLIEKIYSKNPFKVILPLSVLVDKASKKGDKIAKDIMREAGKELALSANTAVRKLNFQKFKFPLVLIGSMFKSKIVLDTVKKEIKKVAPGVKFIRPKAEPVIGAVKLAIETLNNDND